MYDAESILKNTRDICSEWMEQHEELGLNPEVLVSTRLSQEVALLREKLDMQEKRLSIQQVWE